MLGFYSTRWHRKGRGDDVKRDEIELVYIGWDVEETSLFENS